MSRLSEASANIRVSIDDATRELDDLEKSIDDELRASGIQVPPEGRPKSGDIRRDLRARGDEVRVAEEAASRSIVSTFFDNDDDDKTRARKLSDLDALQKKLPRRYDFWSQVLRAFGWTVFGWVAIYLALALPIWFWEDFSPDDENASISMTANFRDYSARMSGAIPVVCYQPEGGAVEIAPDDWTRGGTPLAIQLFWGAPEPNEKAQTCQWRSESVEELREGNSNIPSFLAVHLAAALSVDVGLIQKISLFVFLFGWLLVRRAAQDMKLTIGRLEFGRGQITSKGGESRDTDRPELFPRRRLTISNDRFATSEQTLNVIAQLTDGASGAERLRDPYNIYCETLAEQRGSASDKSLLRDSLWQQSLNYLSDVAGEGQSQKERGPVSERASKRGDSLREDVYRQFSLADFVAWFLPTVGFLGTIYGISTSLVKAKGVFASTNASAGNGADIEKFAEVVDALGTAFDTTAFALLLLAFLMFYKMRQEAKLSSTADEVVRLVRTHLVNNLRDQSDKLDTEIVNCANELVRSLHEYRDRIPKQLPEDG